MLLVNEGTVEMEGMLPEIIQDTVHVLNGVYKEFIEKYGEETANEYFVRIGRISTITDIEERDSQLRTFICELIEMMMKDAPLSIKTVLKQILEKIKEGEK